MRDAILFAPFAWLCRTFGQSACVLAVVVFVAATGQGAAIMLRDAHNPPAAAGPVANTPVEIGLRQPGQRGFQDVPRRVDAGLPEDPYDIDAAVEYGR
ncbi:MAG: hypothetical protein JNJ97_02665 [Alphaproteobacteria bacterium]|nr:hypothetical protein [Alphaproteobacteria bacterium]MCA0451701.1 hypothetical protein [Pseudomonadota bacterium]